MNFIKIIKKLFNFTFLQQALAAFKLWALKTYFEAG